MHRLHSVLLGLVAGVLPATGALSRPLVVYSPHGPEVLQLAQDELKKALPDVTLDWQFLGAEEVKERLAKERARPAADIWWGGPQFTFMQAAKEGLLAAYRGGAAAQVPQAFRDAGDQWLGDLQTPVSIVYNKSLVPTAEVPKDWDDLLRADVKGRLVVRYPMASGTMRALYAALIDRQIAQGRSLDDALAWMRRLDAQVARYESHSQLMFSTIGKGVALYGFWNVPEILMKARQGYPVDFVFPASGMPVVVDCIALVKRADEHPAARAFYDLVTSRDVATKLAGAPYNRMPTRGDVPKTARPAFVDDARYKVMSVDWRRVGEQSAAWLERWEKGVPAAQRPGAKEER